MMKPLLIAGALTIALTGCSFVGALPGVDRLSNFIAGESTPKLTPIETATQTSPARLLGAERGEGALSVVAGQPGWIADPVSNCATSNPFARADEEIRWFGACGDGRVSGQGTLVWYIEGIESERNEGTFRGGEFHGEVITTYPDGEVIVGSYTDGVREGDFTVISMTGIHIRATFRGGELTSEAEMTVTQVDTWRNRRASSYPGVLLAQAASQPPQVSASSPSANRQVVADAPAASPQVMAALLASASAPRPAPTVQLARVDASDRIGTRPANTGARIRGETTGVVAPAEARIASGSAYAGRTAHVTQVLGGPIHVAALETAPPTPAQAVRSDASSVTPRLAASTSFAATGTVLIARDGRAQPFGATQVAQRTLVRLDTPPRGREALRIDRRGTGSLAQRYAGRDGPWVIGARGGTQQDVTPRLARVPVTPIRAATPIAASPATTTADALFSSAYRLELQGRYAGAERLYHDLLLAHPSSPTALLANERLESLRQSRGTVQVAQAASPRQSEHVVSANSPSPRYSGLPPRGTSGNPALALESGLINKTVCSQHGLYGNDARWCGIVTFDEAQFIRVEVTDIKINGFGQIGITRSTCTGNTFLTWFSRGTSIRVPKRCMQVVG
jgi:hypothetical protein